MPAPVPLEFVKLPPVILMPSKRTVAVVPPWPLGLNTVSTLELPATVHLVVGSYAGVSNTELRSVTRARSGSNVGATAHATSSPSLGTIVADATKVQSAPSTKRVAVPRSSALILASMSWPHGMLTVRSA
jgi:hypothetical protein